MNPVLFLASRDLTISCSRSSTELIGNSGDIIRNSGVPGRKKKSHHKDTMSKDEGEMKREEKNGLTRSRAAAEKRKSLSADDADACR